MPSSVQCISCARFRGLGECSAFPDGIPEEILTGEFDHTEPHEGDGGKRFVPLSGDAATDDRLAWPDYD